jgi:hypothetical protein
VVDKEQILSEIRRITEQGGGKAPGRERFAADTGIRESDWLGRYWARWSDAVAEAGFEPNTMQSRTDDEEAIRLLAIETRRLGHLPTYVELKMRRRSDPSLPSTSVYERLGPKATLAGRVAAYCESRPDFGDVLAIVAPLLEGGEEETEEKPGTDEPGELGYVYLLKSGRHYKIGRTNSAGRREYELAIQLPEKAEKIHVISTDDPIGIESYWHRRFADRRKNGEWFELTAADVSAFKRRKFM